MKIFKLVVAVTIVGLALTGCTNPVVAQANKTALEELIQNPLPGFELTETREPTCSIDNCDSNYGYLFRSNDTESDLPTFCTRLVTWAVKHGADSFIIDPDYIALPIKGHEATTQFACVGGMNFSLVGSGKNGPRWLVSGNPQFMEIQTIMNREGQLDDERMIHHSWDEAIPMLFSGTRANMAALDAVNSYRVAHPNEDPSDPKTIEKALKTFPSIKLKTIPKIDIVEDKNGKATHLFIHKDSEIMDRCLNIAPYDPNYFKVPNPGTGFIGMYITEENPVIDQFGYMTSETCRKN